jgi:hypothetical protein
MKYLKDFRIFEMDEYQDEEEDQPREKEVYLVFEDEGGHRTFFASALLGFENNIPYVVGDTIGQDSVMSYDTEAMSEVFDRYEKAGLTTHIRDSYSDSKKADIVYKGWYAEDGDDYEGYYEVDCDALNKAFESGKLKLEKDEEAEDETYYVKVV